MFDIDIGRVQVRLGRFLVSPFERFRTVAQSHTAASTVIATAAAVDSLPQLSHVGHMRARSTIGDGSGGSSEAGRSSSDHPAEMKRRGAQGSGGAISSTDPLLHSSSAVRARSREERERERERNRQASDGSAASAASMSSGGSGGGGMLAPFHWPRPLMSAAAASAASSSPYDVPLLRSTPQIVLSVTLQIAAVQRQRADRRYQLRFDRLATADC